MPESEGGYKEFKIGELFEVCSSKSVDKSGLDLTVNKNEAYQFIGRTQVNNGVQAYTKRLAFNPNPAKTFSVIQVGESVMQYRESPWYASQNIFILKPVDVRLSNNFLYIIAATNKALNRYNGGYNDYPTISTLKQLDIYLPITKSGEINYKYIESCLRELKRYNTEKLNWFFKSNGYTDCTLTDKEQHALDILTNNKQRMDEILLDAIFTLKGVKQSKCQSGIPKKENGIPYIVQSMNNNMCSRNVDRQWLIDNNEPPQEGNSIVLGVTLPAVSYQPFEFGASQVITARNSNLNESVGLYFAVVLSKHMAKFSYQNKPGIQKYKELHLCLPINNDGSIDYDFMETYINALKKQCIARLKASDVFVDTL